MKVVETEYGTVALIEWSEYVVGDSMYQVAEKTGAFIVLLVEDDTINSVDSVWIEALLDTSLGSLRERE